jgi:GxxExxY protein
MRRSSWLRDFVVKRSALATGAGAAIFECRMANARILNQRRLFSTAKSRSHEVFMELINADLCSRRVIGCAIEVHRTLGPGLLETVYEACLCRELRNAALMFVRQQTVPVIDKGEPVACNLKTAIVVEQTLLLEIKAVHAIHPMHAAQLLTCLRRGGLRVGLIMNFNEVRMIDGIRRRLL